jgi:acylphosphatase
MTTSAASQRRRVLYSGHVQGVGFRFTVQRIAQHYTVTGFVRNLPNRQVELVAEGAPAELDRFLAAVAEAMAGYIHKTEARTGPPTGEYARFDIAH